MLVHMHIQLLNVVTINVGNVPRGGGRRARAHARLAAGLLSSPTYSYAGRAVGQFADRCQ